jgi:hypothetical protein
MRKLALALSAVLALAAARILARLTRRGIPDSSLVSLLWICVYLSCSPAITRNTPKALGTAARLNLLIPNIPSPQSQPSTAASGGQSSGGNSSSSMGSTGITYNPQGSSNEGGNNSSTSGQIGGAAAHTHSMTHTHTSSSALQSAVNVIQGSYSTTVANLNSLMTDHNNLVNDHNNLKAALVSSRVLH